MEFWQLGNTSVRSAMRIKDGLTAYSASSIQGNIRRGDGDIAFRRLLGQCGVVSLGEDATHSVGRKWRSAMGKLGFIYPEIKRGMGFVQTDLGQLDMITPAGWNLVRADTVAAMQECYLRSMVTPLFLYFWYVHNLNEQNNPQIAEELSAMQTSARILLKSLFSGSETEVFAFEVGNETIEKWYNASSKQITVTGTFEVETPKVGFEIIGTKWKAYITAVSAKWLKEQYITYKNDLFSGNPRTYLGSGKKKNKINLGIMETIAQQPCNFWAYNNGVTALVNSYSVTEDEDGKEQHLSISGITIINGAQTTGAISSVDTLKDAWVPIRFIVCNDAEIIDEIINNNNKQNEILPSDLRSNDKTQNRLRTEFEPYTKLYYSGGRRGNIRPSRSKEILDPYIVAQALLAFHGDCVTAYNSKNDLWSSDQLYSSIFPENLTAKHIIFTYSLARAIDSYKLELQQKGENRTAIEEKQHKYLAKRGAKMLFLYTVSKCMEGVIGKKVRDNWAFAFRDNSDFDALVCNWKTVIKSILPMSCSPLEIALTDGLKSKELSENAADTVVGLFASVQDTIQSQLNVFTSAIEPQ